MRLRGKKLANFLIGLRYMNRLKKNVLFNFSANRSTKDYDSVILIHRKHAKLYWYIGDPGLKDRVAYEALIKNGFAPRVIFDPTEDDLARINAKLIWINPHHYMFGRARRPDGEHAEQISQYIQKIERNSRTVIPNSQDILFWENKIFMHEQMSERALRHPKSKIITNLTFQIFSELEQEFGLPFLIKMPDGYSSKGLHLITNEKEFQKLCPARRVIVQEFLNISMDLRLIMVNGETASFYWRKNQPSEDWKPTATSGGATVEFKNLPRSAEQLGADIYEKFGLKTFGADITWRNDDLLSDPYVLEFSPIYQPNPNSPKQRVTKNYTAFKQKTIFAYDTFFEHLVGQIFERQLLDYRKHEE